MMIYMTPTTATANAVSAAAEASGITPCQLAERTGLNSVRLSDQMRGLESFTVEDIDRIAVALDAHPTTLAQFEEVAK